MHDLLVYTFHEYFPGGAVAGSDEESSRIGLALLMLLSVLPPGLAAEPELVFVIEAPETLPDVGKEFTGIYDRQFVDSGEIAPWAKAAVYWACTMN